MERGSQGTALRLCIEVGTSVGPGTARAKDAVPAKPQEPV
jgi:hypothetical protein